MNIDPAMAAFTIVREDIDQLGSRIATEQDARIQIIDRLLIEVLGWPRSAIKTEDRTDSGYLDYLLSSQGRSLLVVEAKKASKILVDTHSPRVAAYKVGGPALKAAFDGLEQAKRYCADTATLFAALTSGVEWIAYWALRTDSRPPSEGKAIVFPSLDAIEENFAIFYDLFSLEGVQQQLYQVLIHEREGLQVQNTEDLEPVIPESDIRLLPKEALASDLGSIFRQFFSTMSGDNNPEMLAKCFVESKESREADASLQKIAENVLNRIDAVEPSTGQELQSEIRTALETQRGDFVLIVGEKGAGKSTFIDRFFRLVLEKSLRRQCLVIRIDLADSTGELATSQAWLTQQIKLQLEARLFNNGIPTFDDLQGLFIQDYDRWRYGEHKYLYDRDKGEFKEKFGEWLASLIQGEPDRYVQELLRSTVSQRRRMPCIVFDNSDHFPLPFQEAVFQYAQGVFRSVYAFVICPITDRTIWQLSKEGPLQSYDVRAFYLPVPSTKDVLAKRVSFLKEKVNSEGAGESGQYSLTDGIRLNIGDIGAFAAAIEDIFIHEDYVGRIIGWLANHDIRRSLKIAERIISSPTLAVGTLVKAYVVGHGSRPRRREVKMALLVGNYEYYKSSQSEFILNVFEVSPMALTSPLLRLSILRLLMDRANEARDSSTPYVSVEDIENYFEPTGIARRVVEGHLSVLLEFRLVEPYDPTDVGVYPHQQVRVTHAGRIHYEFAFATGEANYIQQMALTTPLRSIETLGEIKGILQIGYLSWEHWREIVDIFASYCFKEDKQFVALPEAQVYNGQRELRERFKSSWRWADDGVSFQ